MNTGEDKWTKSNQTDNAKFDLPISGFHAANSIIMEQNWLCQHSNAIHRPFKAHAFEKTQCKSPTHAISAHEVDSLGANLSLNP